MKQLLHERLRNHTRIEQGCIETDSGVIVTSLNKNEMLALVDEIEKYYIPRPRFEDGEPVQFGEEFADCSGNPHTLHEIRYRDKAAAGLGAKCLLEANTTSPKDYDGISFNLWDGKFVKRHEPKVLDADGVEIKVGDTVWHVKSDNAFSVRNLEPFEVFESVTGVTSTWFKPCEFTHREPDSLKKLLHDMSNAIKGVKGQLFDCDKHLNLNTVEKWADRLTALMERDA